MLYKPLTYINSINIEKNLYNYAERTISRRKRFKSIRVFEYIDQNKTMILQYIYHWLSKNTFLITGFIVDTENVALIEWPENQNPVS